MPELLVFAPGSTSNLGPGFDCLGLAFTGKGDRVSVRVVPGPGVRVAWVSDPRIPTDPARNTAAIAASAVLRLLGSETGLELRVEKGLPLSGGMGGSAASAVAGAVAADAVLDAGLPREALLAAALHAEAVVAGRHADNVAPSLLGGCVLVQGIDPLRIAMLRIHPDLALVLVTPGYAVETVKARAVLPSEVPRGQAVAQAAFLAGLVLGLERGDLELIGRSMVDRIAEPARLPLYPGYAATRLAGLEAGAAGVAVSGAGPTVVAIVPRPRSSAVGAAMERAYANDGIACTVHEAEVDPTGARVIE